MHKAEAQISWGVAVCRTFGSHVLMELIIYAENFWDTTLAFSSMQRGKDFFQHFDAFEVSADIDMLVGGVVQFGIARMYQAMTERTGAELRVFRDEPEAKRWLGLET